MTVIAPAVISPFLAAALLTLVLPGLVPASATVGGAETQTIAVEAQGSSSW